jgi:predicted MFS family arabinose efflux permease
MSVAETHPPTSMTVTLRSIPAAVWALLLGTFINKLGAFLQIFLVLYLIQRGFSADQAGLALGIYGAGSIAGVITGGWVTDRFGCRWTIVGSMISSAALTVALLYAPSYPLILAFAAATGAAQQAYRPASSALLVALTPQSQHVMVFAIYRLAFNLGMTAGPLIGAFFAQLSFGLLLWADGLTSLIFGLIAIWALRNAQAPAPSNQVQSATGGYRRVLADRRYLCFLLALFLNAVVYIQYIATLPLHIAAAGLPTELFGVLVSLNALIVIVCELPITRFVQHLPARVAVALGIGLVGVGLNLYVLPPQFALLVIATLVWSIGEIVGTPAASAYPARVAPAQLRGRYLAAAAVPQSIGYALGPVIGALAWTRIGTAVWWGCGLITLLAILATCVGIRPGPAQDHET